MKDKARVVVARAAMVAIIAAAPLTATVGVASAEPAQPAVAPPAAAQQAQPVHWWGGCYRGCGWYPLYGWFPWHRWWLW